MVSENEIEALVNKQWVDRRNNVDDLLGASAQLQIVTNTKLDSLINAISEISGIPSDNGNNDGNNVNITDILPGDFGVSLFRANVDSIISCVIKGIITNAIAKTDIGRYESVIVVPGGTSDEPYVVSMATLIKGEYAGFPVNVAVTEEGYILVSVEGYTAKDEPATENPILAGMEYEALGSLTTDADTVGDKVPWKASQKGVPYVALVDSEGNGEASIAAADVAKTVATIVQAMQHIDATGKVQPAGEAVTNSIHVAIGDGVETVDIETVESDIDGKDAITTNSLMYGKVSSGVTTPLHVDSQGDLVITVTPGSALYGEKLPTASCAAGAAIEFDIASFSDLATLKQISITQITAGTYDYTLEIWEKDGSGYTPGTYADHYLKIFSRDIDVREYNENIDNGLLYRDRDATTELHCRLVNNAAGTTSTFNVSIVAVNNT